MVQGGGVVTVMTLSRNMNLFLAGNPVFWKACKVSGVVYMYIRLFEFVCVSLVLSNQVHVCSSC